MKYFSVICFIVIALFSCQKETSQDGDPIPGPSSGNCRLAKMVQGLNGDDTVHVIKYDSASTMIQVIDQTYKDTMQLVYANNWLWQAVSPHRRTIYTRNNKGKITSIEGSLVKTTITYTDDTIYKAASNWYPDNGRWVLVRNFVFELNAANDIIEVKEYTPGGTLVGQQQVTYTDIPNPFGAFDVMNYQNQLGMMDVNPLFEFGFSPTKLVKTHTDGSYAYSVDYEVDENNNVIKSAAATDYNGIRQGVFTRQYFYECE